MKTLFDENVRVVSWERKTLIFPGQWEGVLADGRFIYIRYRFGSLSFGIGPTEGEAVGNTQRWANAPQSVDDAFMKDSEMIGLMSDCGVSFENAGRRGPAREEY